MEFLIGLMFAVIGVLAIIVALGFILPDRQVVTRFTTILAPPEKVYPLVVDFHHWGEWSPWAKLDPDMQQVITGEGIGHRMAWSSAQKNVGNGVQEITALDENKMVQTHLAFEGMGAATARLDLKPVPEGTEVVWSFEANMREGASLWRQPMATYFGYFMDKFVGADYEKGLAALKEIVESR